MGPGRAYPVSKLALCKGQTRLRTMSGAPPSWDRAPAPGWWRCLGLRQGGTGVRGDQLSDGVGLDATVGVHKAEVSHLHAARRQDMLEEAA